jgi:hypothetical protein
VNWKLAERRDIVADAGNVNGPWRPGRSRARDGVNDVINPNFDRNASQAADDAALGAQIVLLWNSSGPSFISPTNHTRYIFQSGTKNWVSEAGVEASAGESAAANRALQKALGRGNFAASADSVQAAIDFSTANSAKFEQYVSQRMAQLGIPKQYIGDVVMDGSLRGQTRAFVPYDITGGAVTPITEHSSRAGISVNSGVFNDALMDGVGLKTAQAWRSLTGQQRIDAVIAHEYAELIGGTHASGLAGAPNLPGLDKYVVEFLKLMAAGE